MQEYIEVYLLYPYVMNKREKKGDLKQFFTRLDDLDNQMVGQPVFLNKEKAMQYNRFMGNAYTILRAFVLDAAIEGCSQGLVLKKGYITKSQVHSCVICCCNEASCYENPNFDHTILTSCYF